MFSRPVRHLRRNFVAYLALFVALSGASYAASSSLLPRNSVGTRQVINGSLQKGDLSNAAVSALKGRKGAPGIRGRAGSQGLKGATGAAGPQGTKGDSGVVGNLDQLDGRPCTIKDEQGVTLLWKAAAYEGFWTDLICLIADEYEPNDTEGTASDLTPDYDTSLTVAASMYPAGEIDWYTLTGKHLGSVCIESGPGPVYVSIYMDGVRGDVISSFEGEQHCASYDATAPHDWKFMVGPRPIPQSRSAYYLILSTS
jgi:hypothetical protein